MNRFRAAFNRNDYWMAAAAIVLGAYFLAKEWTMRRAPAEPWPWPEILVAVTGLAFGIALLGGVTWARWLGLPWLLALAAMVIIDGTRLGWDFPSLASVGLFFAPRDDVK